MIQEEVMLYSCLCFFFVSDLHEHKKPHSFKVSLVLLSEFAKCNMYPLSTEKFKGKYLDNTN